LKCQIELAIARCLRPDLIQTVLHKLIGSIYDFNYTGFNSDILSKFIDPDGTLSMRRHKATAVVGRANQQNMHNYVPPKKEDAKNNIRLLI